MIKNNLLKLHKKQEGQTLVIVFVMMVISLSIGIAISSRYVKTLNIITTGDNTSRAHAVGEAAIEHILLLPISTLEDYAQNGTCGSDCTLSITADDGQVITATIELSRLGSSSEPFLVELDQTSTSQVMLTGYPDNTDLNVCWNESDMSVHAIFIHGTKGSYVADSMSYNPPTTTHSDNNFDMAAPAMGFNQCFTFNSQTDPSMVRLKSYYQDGSVMVVPSTGANLPTQGILIESTGVAGTSVKKVSVIITDPILPAIFDYALYQKSTTDPLSN
jgi:hypothetical protein